MSLNRMKFYLFSPIPKLQICLLLLYNLYKGICLIKKIKKLKIYIRGD